MAYKGHITVTKALADGELPRVRKVGGSAFVTFGHLGSGGDIELDLFGSPDGMAVALSAALTDVQRLIDAENTNEEDNG